MTIGERQSESPQATAGWGRRRNKPWEGAKTESAEGNGGYGGVKWDHVARAH